MSASHCPKNKSIAANQATARPVPVAFAFLAAIFLGGCDFQGHLVPLELPTAPPQPFQGSVPEEELEIKPAEQAPERPSRTFGDITSEAAIEICQGHEFFGDEDVGTCLAPGGEGYYVWIDPDLVILVDRADPYLQSFQIASLSREIEQAGWRETLSNWPNIPILLFETGAAGVSCGATIGSLLSGVAAPTSPLWGGGCVASLVALGATGYSVSVDAEAGAKAIIEFQQRDSDARYNYCRMEGGSDEQCREQAEGR